MAMCRFGKFLVDIGIIDNEDLVEALNIQRRRELIPLGEIALHMNMISANQLMEILDYQSRTKDKFGRIAIALGYIDSHQLQLIIEKKKKLRSFLGSILVELHKVGVKEMDVALTQYYAEKKNILDQEKGRKYKLNNFGVVKRRTKKVFSDAPIDADQSETYPVVNTEATCPICHMRSQQRYLVNSSYSVVQKDIDLKPTKYEWMKEVYNKHNPLLYDVWECPSCHFCADRQHFHDPVCDVSGGSRLFCNKVRNLLVEEPTIFRVIELFSTNSVDNPLPEITYDVAVRRYMIAIYILQNIDQVSKLDALPLGKYYLRLAWLYREIDNVEANTPLIKNLIELKTQASNYWSTVPVTENAALDLSVKYYETAVYESTINLMKETEHKIFQLLARINIGRGEFDSARSLLHEGLKCVYHLKGELENSLKGVKGLKQEQLYEEVLPKLRDINTFYIETNDLLYHCKELSRSSLQHSGC